MSLDDFSMNVIFKCDACHCEAQAMGTDGEAEYIECPKCGRTADIHIIRQQGQSFLAQLVQEKIGRGWTGSTGSGVSFEYRPTHIQQPMTGFYIEVLDS